MQISEQAKASVNHIFMKAAKANLILSQDDVCDIETLQASKGQEMVEKNIFVLTISSYLFRILVIFHVNDDKQTKNYFTQSDAERLYDEVFAELANLSCGAMNRDLGNYFPHLGLSTPYMLTCKCMPYLKELKPGHISQFKISINSSVLLHATICICAYTPFDFKVDMSAPEEETGGLELF